MRFTSSCETLPAHRQITQGVMTVMDSGVFTPQGTIIIADRILAILKPGVLAHE
jgi:hypothetical protein